MARHMKNKGFEGISPVAIKPIHLAMR
jgi:hypothetical protein